MESTSLAPTRWPVDVPAQVQAELELVYDQCAGVSLHDLEVFAEFSPFGIGLRRNGRMTLAGGPLLTPTPVEPIAFVYETFAALAPDLRALAVVEDVGTEDSPFLRIYCAHHAGHAFRVSVPWRRLVDDNVQMLPPLVERTDAVPW